MAGPDLRQHLAARGHRLGLERLHVCPGKDLAGDDARHQPFHPQGRDQRQRPGSIHRREQAAGIGAVLVAVKGVAHPELDLFHRDAGVGAQLDRALADGHRIAPRIPQLDAGARTDRQLAAELHARAESRLQLPRLPLCSRLRRVALGENGVPAGVHHVPRDPVRLPDGGHAHGNTPGGPLLARPPQAVLVVVAKLFQLHPGRSRPLRRLQELQRPPARCSVADRQPRSALGGPRLGREGTARHHHDLLPALQHADRDQRLATLEREARRVEKLQGIVGSGSAGEEIVLRAQPAREQRAAEEGEKRPARRLHLRRWVRST